MAIYIPCRVPAADLLGSDVPNPFSIFNTPHGVKKKKPVRALDIILISRFTFTHQKKL